MSEYAKIAVPATRSSAATLKVRRRAVLVALVACVLTGIVGLVFAVSASSKVDGFEAPREPFGAIAVAEQGAADFLTYTNSQVPAAEGVNTSWGQVPDESGNLVPVAKNQKPTLLSLNFIDYSAPAVGDAGDGAIQLYIMRFRASVSYPVLQTEAQGPVQDYFVDVPVRFNTAGVAVLADSPVLLPTRAGADSSVGRLNYEQLYGNGEEGTGLVDDKSEAAIKRWLAVYPRANANGDVLDENGEVIATMSDVTLDNTAGRVWPGLGGWVSTGEYEVISAVPARVDEENGRPSGFIVQVEVVFANPAANGLTMRSTYDLYVVAEQGQAEYPVIAWGPAGSAESLTEKTNRKP